MTQTGPFNEILESVDSMTMDKQEELLAILKRRLTQYRRQRLLADVEEARREIAAGCCQVMTPEVILRAIHE